MASLNKATIIGNLGRDPEIRAMQSGESAATLAIATTEKWVDKTTGEKREATEWHRVTFFGKLAEICGQYLKKGSSVYVEGKITTKKYTDKDGIERYQTSIQGQEMKMLGGAPQGQQQPAPQAQAPQQRPAPAARPAAPRSDFSDMEDSIPF